MGIIEKLRNNKPAAYTLAGSLILLAVIISSIQFWPAKTFKRNASFFSDDDGKTWFEDSLDNIPPYDHNGKQAARAVIFSYANGSKQFCGYLLRYNPETKKAIQAAVAASANKNPPVTAYDVENSIEFSGRGEVRKPGAPADQWIPMSNGDSLTIMAVKSPDGSVLDSVLP